MVIEIRDGSEVPIYLQLRNQIVSGISAGACCCSRRGQPLTSTIRITPS